MAHITKAATIKTTAAIWEFDPTLPDNRLHGNSLNVIAAIRTVTIKIQASGQRIEYFNKLQVQCSVKTPLKIPLHGNTRWGSAYGMLDRAYKLRRVSKTIICSYWRANIFLCDRQSTCSYHQLTNSMGQSQQFARTPVFSKRSRGVHSSLARMIGSWYMMQR